MRDGDEVKVEAQLIYSFVEGDSSVGIPTGFVLLGLEVNGKLLEMDDVDVKGKRLIAVDEAGTRALHSIPDSFEP